MDFSPARFTEPDVLVGGFLPIAFAAADTPGRLCSRIFGLLQALPPIAIYSKLKFESIGGPEELWSRAQYGRITYSGVVGNVCLPTVVRISGRFVPVVDRFSYGHQSGRLPVYQGLPAIDTVKLFADTELLPRIPNGPNSFHGA